MLNIATLRVSKDSMWKAIECLKLKILIQLKSNTNVEPLEGSYPVSSREKSFIRLLDKDFK